MKITESGAVNRYIALRYKPELLGADLNAQAQHENLHFVIVELIQKTLPFALKWDEEQK